MQRRSIREVFLLTSKFSLTASFAFTAIWTFAFEPSRALAQEVRLLARGSIPGDASDLSGREESLEDGSPANRLGGFSAIEHLEGDEYLVLSDRGPGDGAVDFSCRVHRFHLSCDLVNHEIYPELRETTLLKHPNGKSFSGGMKSLVFDEGDRSRALDPEGLRRLPNGELLTSDEYGPCFDRFRKDGTWLGGWAAPPYFRLSKQAIDVMVSAPPGSPIPMMGLSEGTLPNRGMEGLAISVDGQRVVGAMQGPLVQDCHEEGGKLLGAFTRLVEYSLNSSNPKKPVNQWIYPLENPSCGISEILAVDANHYLVIERDSQKGSLAKFKRIYEIDTRGATNIGERTKLDSHQLEEGMVPVRKKLLIDLLDPVYGFSGDDALEKPEGLALGHRMEDGSLKLMVCVDNDFVVGTPSRFLMFAWQRMEGSNP